MTELTIDITAPAAAAPVEPVVLVTEREVLLASAAALAGAEVRVPRRRTLWRAMTATPRPPRTHRSRSRSRRPDFIEDAMMARMMERL
ncbi:hypothetical protein MJO55_15645 [Mycolicibacterium rufum]|uniref:Uncharacterized protein n=1 Tax=Mycolicibacterium rufum TaxID=318424 RepID=A0A9X3BG07_9MYCO|nr:hypothetical protein [Mycolicibacterium rufum]MCV7070734.1 hypothetical protein [Mycolicibacterium rufum]ULP34765.1 hypothetical protein MJO55_15645 [Mycolicibacterium rufum]